MKKIKLTVASILLSGVVFAQTNRCCQMTAQEVYEYEGLTVTKTWPISKLNDEKVIMEHYDHLEAINTIEDLIEWIAADVKSDDVKPCIGVGYLENLDEVLRRLKNRSILIENED